MKTLATFIAVLIATSLCAQQKIKPDAIKALKAKINTQLILKTDSVYITGHVSNYDKFKDSANSVQVIINDLAMGDQLTYRAKINSKGDYRLAFIKTGMQDVMLEYNEALQGILVVPGHHMKIDFDAADFDDHLTFSDDDADINRQQHAYDKAKYAYDKAIYTGDSYNRFRAQSKSEQEAKPAAHKKFLTDRFNKENAFLNNYIAQHQLSPVFVTWVKADLHYEYLENLMRYTWLHPKSKKTVTEDLKIPDSYFDFIKLADMNNTGATVTSHYGLYVGEYSRYMIGKTFGNSARVADLYQMLFKQPAGLLKDVMLSNNFYGTIEAKQLEVVKPYLAKYKANVKQPALRLFILRAYTEAADRLNNYTMPVNAQLNTLPKSEADSLFSKIVAKYAGKVVYVDFWATWCGPCRAEMPNSKILHDKLAGKDVVFLYLGVQSEEKTWKASIAEMGVEGEHFLLSNNDFSAISAKFQISGIPRYLLVDKAGRVADETAKRPGDDELKKDIEKLLAAK